MIFKSRIVPIVTLCLSFSLLNGQSSDKSKIKLVSEEDSMELSGSIKGLKEGELVILRRLEFGKKEAEFIDSSRVSNGKFYFKHHVNSAPQYFTITFSKHEPFIALPLSNEKCLITSRTSLDNMEQTNLVDYVIVDGSKTFSDWVYIGLGIGRTWYYSNQMINGSINKHKNSILSTVKLEHVSALLKAKQALANSAFSSMDYEPARDIVPIYFRDAESEIQHSSIWPEIYSRISDIAKKSFYGKWMADRMSLCVGQQSPDFSFTPTNGANTSLHLIAKKSHLTILHFWSNNSAERVRIHKELENVYNKYKAKGLEVVSVSLDANPEKWKRVVKDDKIPGYQFCDFKEEEGPIAQLYKMDTNSTVNILIAQNGKILAWDVDGPSLLAHLYDAFGE